MIRRLDIDLAIYRDRVQATDRHSGQFVDQRAEYPFSDVRLVCDGKAFEHACSHALRKLLTGGLILSEVSAHVGATELPLSSSERDLVRQALNHLGIRAVDFGEDTGI